MLSEADITTFEKATQIALAIEMTTEDMKTMRAAEVHAIRGREQKRDIRIGEGAKWEDSRETKEEKRFIVECYYCKKRGHIMRDCWLLQKKRNNNSKRSKYVIKQKNKM